MMITLYRDIKGANLLVDANGIVKLADFGMAKHVSSELIIINIYGSAKNVRQSAVNVY